MRDDSIEFDSDKLGMLYLDFGDVAQVHSPQVTTCLTIASLPRAARPSPRIR